MDSGGGKGKPRVLAITLEKTAIRQIRLDMPFFNLKKHGLIDDYLVTGRRFENLPDDFLFDTVWLQREIHPKVAGLVEELFGDNYVYDIDDLLIGQPSYTMSRWDESGRRRALIIKALRRCRVLSCSTGRLVGILERCTGTVLSHKAVVCPNGFEFSKALRKPEPPQGLIWTSSDFPALMHSRDAIVNAIRRFSEKYGLPVYCFGHLTDPITKNIPNLVELGVVPFFHHKALLGSFPPLIGVVPLETVADEADLDFINAKSDVKMVELGGFGHPSVYSNALPYADSELRCGAIVPNDESAWFDAMENIYREKWKELDADQARVIEARNMDRLAVECWYPAIRKARLDKPLSGSDVKNKLSRWGKVRRIFTGQG